MQDSTNYQKRICAGKLIHCNVPTALNPHRTFNSVLKEPRCTILSASDSVQFVELTNQIRFPERFSATFPLNSAAFINGEVPDR